MNSLWDERQETFGLLDLAHYWMHCILGIIYTPSNTYTLEFNVSEEPGKQEASQRYSQNEQEWQGE